MSLAEESLVLRELCSTLRVLIVDDNERLANDYATFAKRFFRDVTVMTSSMQAKEEYRTDQFDIIYTDINMPQLDGIELIKAIRVINPEQYFIVLSGSNDADNLLSLLEIGVSTFILKPFEIKRFMDSTYNVASSIIQQRMIKDTADELQAALSHTIEEKNEQENMLIQQSKLAQTGEMISMIAHQWRQPLAHISSLISKMMIKNELGLFDDEKISRQDAIHEYELVLQEIQKATLNLSKTINDFRDFYRPETSTVSFNVNDSLKQTIDISMISYDITIETEYCEDEKAFIDSYDTQFKQVIINLLNNARDALHENKIQSPKICIRTVADAHNVVVDISDNAGGIKEEIIDKIFLPYFSTKDKQHGTGIGLHMVKTIVEKNIGGSVEVSNTDRGALFSVRLPKDTKRKT